MGVESSMLDLMQGLVDSSATAFSMTYSMFSSLFSIAIYVITALSLYTIAKRRFVSHAWLAWVPGLQFWVVGSIADNYQWSIYRKEKNKRKVMLWMFLILVVLALILCVTLVVAIVSLIGAGYNHYENPADYLPALASFGGMLILALVMGVISIIYVVFYYMALYDLYRSCSPENATLYLLLNIFFSVTQPIFLLICRNKDDGMRHPASPANPYYNNDPCA